jgi:hypothetical protein
MVIWLPDTTTVEVPAVIPKNVEVVVTPVTGVPVPDHVKTAVDDPATVLTSVKFSVKLVPVAAVVEVVAVAEPANEDTVGTATLYSS